MFSMVPGQPFTFQDTVSEGPRRRVISPAGRLRVAQPGEDPGHAVRWPSQRAQAGGLLSPSS